MLLAVVVGLELVGRARVEAAVGQSIAAAVVPVLPVLLELVGQEWVVVNSLGRRHVLPILLQNWIHKWEKFKPEGYG